MLFQSPKWSNGNYDTVPEESPLCESPAFPMSAFLKAFVGSSPSWRCPNGVMIGEPSAETTVHLMAAMTQNSEVKASFRGVREAWSHWAPRCGVPLIPSLFQPGNCLHCLLVLCGMGTSGGKGGWLEAVMENLLRLLRILHHRL